MLTRLKEIGAISYAYDQDPMLLAKHARMAYGSNRCYYNNIITTGSGLVNYLGLLELLCNGGMELVDDIIKLQDT